MVKITKPRQDYKEKITTFSSWHSLGSGDSSALGLAVFDHVAIGVGGTVIGIAVTTAIDCKTSR